MGTRAPWIRLLICLCSFVSGATYAAEDSWANALAGMHLREAVVQLNRTNCLELMLHSFHSNHVVKALIFMPGATDEFYMFRRARANLTNPTPSLLDAVVALTNQTLIRAVFKPPFLLLHTDEDPLKPDVMIQNTPTAARLKTCVTSEWLCNDSDWDSLQPLLKWRLKMDVRPWRYSEDSWHFYRHSLAAFGLTGFEAIEAAMFAGKTKCVISRNRVTFSPDPRALATPKFWEFPR